MQRMRNFRPRVRSLDMAWWVPGVILGWVLDELVGFGYIFLRDQFANPASGQSFVVQGTLVAAMTIGVVTPIFFVFIGINYGLSALNLGWWIPGVLFGVVFNEGVGWLSNAVNAWMMDPGRGSFEKGIVSQGSYILIFGIGALVVGIFAYFWHSNSASAVETGD